MFLRVLEGLVDGQALGQVGLHEALHQLLGVVGDLAPARLVDAPVVGDVVVVQLALVVGNPPNRWIPSESGQNHRGCPSSQARVHIKRRVPLDSGLGSE